MGRPFSRIGQARRPPTKFQITAMTREDEEDVDQAAGDVEGEGIR